MRWVGAMTSETGCARGYSELDREAGGDEGRERVEEIISLYPILVVLFDRFDPNKE